MSTILIADDDQSIRDTLRNYFERKNFKVYCAVDGKDAFNKILLFRPSIVLSDIRMPQMSGLELVENIKKESPEICFVLMTAYDDMQTTIDAIQKGAYDYIEKPIELTKLNLIIERAVENKKISEKLENIIEISEEEIQKHVIVGKTPVMKSVFKVIGQVAGNRVTTLIQGESGTGKELIARAIHKSGVTATHPFVAINCTALTETLLESELFGHVKGAFTGSIRDKKGKFEIAGEGTIFLDEISEISSNLQVKLLRVIQEREFERVGGENLIPMQARLIVATNKNLQKLVESGKFREDLFYRLNVVTINVPPLRERREDIPQLVNHFLSKTNTELHKNVSKIHNDVMEMLIHHDWVGNVRELENTLLQAVVLTKGDVLNKENILLREVNKLHSDFDDVTRYTLKDIEKNHIEKMLKAVAWDKPKAAKYLGVSLPTLYSKIESYEIERK